VGDSFDREGSIASIVDRRGAVFCQNGLELQRSWVSCESLLCLRVIDGARTLLISFGGSEALGTNAMAHSLNMPAASAIVGRLRAIAPITRAVSLQIYNRSAGF
jgi:hypothetical protein